MTADRPNRQRGGLATMTRLAIHRPIGTLAITLVIFIGGLLSLQQLAVDLLPTIEYPQIRISVNYPGVSPEVMEQQITRVIERGVSGIENLTRIESRVRQGRTDLDLSFRFGTHLDFALQDVARNIEQIRNRLPDAADQPRVRKFDPGMQAVWRGGFSSTVRSEAAVTDWVENSLAPQLLMIEGVSAVEAIGGQIREIEVAVDQQRLTRYGLTLRDVEHALAALLAGLLPMVLFGSVSGELELQQSGDLSTWSAVDVTPEMVTAEGTIRLEGLPNSAFFRLYVSDFEPRDVEPEPKGMVLVEGGTLTTSSELNGTVVSPFLIGVYEVTWGEWQTVRAN